MKRFVTICILLCCLLFTGCVGSTFETVEPPLKTYPEAEEYTLTEVFSDKLIVSRTLTGGLKSGSTLIVNSSSSSTASFKEGDQGTVVYKFLRNGNWVEASVKGVLTVCPEEGIGQFVVTHEETSSVPDKSTGSFYVTERTISKCLQLPRSAVTLLNNDGDAVVYLLNESGTLADRMIRVGDTDGEYYEIVSGLSEGEKVVLR